MNTIKPIHSPAYGSIEKGNVNSAGNRSLETIASEIKKQQDTSNRSYLEIGRLLLEAREKEDYGKYGKWTDWLKDNVDISICKAQRLIHVAKWMDGWK